jgi:NADH-quinone oxidoreductase subunit L
MLFPLYALAAGAVLAGVIFAPYFLGEHAHDFWRGAVPLHAEHAEPPLWVVWAPFTVTAIGLVFAVLFYLVNTSAAKALAKGPLHAFLYNKWYFDEIYHFIFVRGAKGLGDLLWKWGDQKTIDGLGPDGFAAVSRFAGRSLRRLQTGFVYHYSFLMLAAAVAFGAYAIWIGVNPGTIR